MLVLLSPEFSGSELQVAQLAQVTGLLPYDLRTRLRPGVWGVLRVLADFEQAQLLVGQLTALEQITLDARRQLKAIKLSDLLTPAPLVKLAY